MGDFIGRWFKTGCSLIVTFALAAGIFAFNFTRGDRSFADLKRFVQRLWRTEVSDEPALGGLCDPSRVDLEEVLASASSVIEKDWPEARLATLHADNVRPDGRADLTLGNGAILDVKFVPGPGRSGSGAQPKGVTGGDKIPCRGFHADERGLMNPMPVGNEGCLEAPGPAVPALPRCTVPQVWERAIERGAPSEDAVASIAYTASSYSTDTGEEGTGEWTVEIGESFMEVIPDDCS